MRKVKINSEIVKKRKKKNTLAMKWQQRKTRLQNWNQIKITTMSREDEQLKRNYFPRQMTCANIRKHKSQDLSTRRTRANRAENPQSESNLYV